VVAITISRGSMGCRSLVLELVLELVLVLPSVVGEGVGHMQAVLRW